MKLAPSVRIPLRPLLLSAFCLAVGTAPLSAQSPPPAPPAPPTFAAFHNSLYAPSPDYIRFGAPITFSGRLLPPDATGTLTFAIDGAPFQTVPVATQSIGDYIALGDSVTYAGYISNPVERYQNLIGQALHLNVNAYGAPGYTACDLMPLEVMPNNVGTATATSPLYSILIGANDVTLYGAGQHEALFNLCHQATLAWLGVPRASKVLAGDAGLVVTSGQWTSATAPTSCCLNALTAATGNGTPAPTLRFTVNTTGAPAYLWYSMQVADPGFFTVSVDGGPPTSPIPTQFSSGPELLPNTFGYIRLPVAAPGTHSFDITAVSGTVAVLGMGSPAQAGVTPPTILNTDIPNQINGDDAGLLEYIANIQANIALLHADGLDIRFVPTRPYMLATPDEMMDNKHPSALGLSHIAQAIVAAVTPASPARDTVAAAAASIMLSNLPIGGHTIDMAYSGDAKYAATGGSTGLVIYDGSSATTLAADAPIYAVRSPIVLTASIAQANANGLVNFFEQTSTGNTLLGAAWMNFGLRGTSFLRLPSLAPGLHTVFAQYLGDAHYNGSVSPSITVNVSASVTAISLSAPATSFAGGTSVPLTAIVSPSSATGSVTFLDGSAVLAQVPLSNGSATFSAANLAVGVHLLTATFNGTGTLNSSASPVLAIQVVTNPTTIALAPTPASIVYGTPLSLAASVSPATASGSAVFRDSFSAGGAPSITQTLGQNLVINGIASITLPPLAPGSHTFDAVYGGDAFNLPSLSSSFTTVVTLAPSTLTLAPVAPSSTFGSSVTFTASITPAASTGSIAFTDSTSGRLATVALINGSASFSISTLAPGPHALTATYAGDNFRSASTSPSVSIDILPAASSTVLATLPATIYTGNPLLLSASVAPASATGTVLFRDAQHGTLGQAAVSGGIATLALASPAVAAYTITAIYSGDANNSASTSAPVSTVVALNPTSLTLAASSSATLIDSPVTLFATAANSSTSGVISFFDGAKPIGSAMLLNGKASLTTASLAPGTHSLQASFPGDSLYAAATSATFAETITLGSSAISLTLAQNPVIAGSPLVVNLRVASTYTVPGGTVALRSGSALLASAPLANAGNGAAFATVTINSASLGLGSFPLVAVYSGDSNDQPSDSAATPLNAVVSGIPTAAALSLSATRIPVGSTVNITASLVSSASNPTGSITFLKDGTAFASAQLNASGTASASLNALPVGAYNLSAIYTPTGLFAAGAPATQQLTVTPPFTLALAPASLRAAPGTSTSATVVLTPLSGYLGNAQTSCHTSASFIACTVDPIPQFAGTAPLSAAVHITLSQTSRIATPARPGPARTVPFVLALLFPIFLGANRKKRGASIRRRLGLFALAMAFAIFASSTTGCAEGGNFGTVPAGLQTATITGTGSGTAVSTTLTINVAY